MNCRCDVCVRCKHELNFNEFDQMIKLNFLSRSTGHGRHDGFSPGDLLAVGNNSGLPLWCFCYIVQMENIYSFSLWWWWSAGNLIRLSMELSLAGSYNSTSNEKSISHIFFFVAPTEGPCWVGEVTALDVATCCGSGSTAISVELYQKLVFYHIFAQFQVSSIADPFIPTIPLIQPDTLHKRNVGRNACREMIWIM